MIAAQFRSVVVAALSGTVEDPPMAHVERFGALTRFLVLLVSEHGLQKQPEVITGLVVQAESRAIARGLRPPLAA